MTEYTDADQNAVTLVEVAVAAVGVASVIATAPSGMEAALAVVSLEVAIANIRPGSPFHRVAFACEELADRLDKLENGGGDTPGIQELRKKVADAWKGPGADAFDAYVNGELLDGIRSLGKAGKDAAPIYKNMGDSLDWGLEGYFVITIASTIAQIALNLILASSAGTAAPWIIAAKIGAAVLTIAAIVGLIFDTVGGLGQDVNMTGSLAVTNESLIVALSESSNQIESSAVALSGEELATVGNPDDWGKE